MQYLLVTKKHPTKIKKAPNNESSEMKTQALDDQEVPKSAKLKKKCQYFTKYEYKLQSEAQLS